MTQKEDETKEQALNQVKTRKTIWIGSPTPPFTKHYKISKQLGEPGQFGVTYRCIRKSDKKTFAVKLLNKNRFYRIPLKHRHKYLRAMHDEIEILQTLDHKYIISLEAVYEDKPTLYIVMEECTGGELFQRIVKKGQYSEKEAAYVIKQILEALKYMHEVNNIVHCDLKPDNILFLNKEEKSPLKLIDFGMSKVLPRLQYLTQLCGTPYYTAPEIISQKKFNHQCDTWSVGVIMYVMLFGYPPFYVDPEIYGKRERHAIYEKIKKGFIPKVRSTKQYGYGPWFPNHIKVSKDARNLISNLLKKKVDKRFSAQEALSHPWITSLGGDNKSSSNVTKQILTSIAKFSNTCQFKLVVVQLFRNQFQKMRPYHFKQLEDLFQKMDKNGDGILTYDEFEKAITSIPEVPLEKKHIEQMFKELDIGKKKGIRFEDLLNAVVHDYLVACDERLYAAFSELDTNDTGIIDTKDLKKKLKELDPLGEWDRAIKIIEEQCLDRNGKIDYEEFLVNLHPNFDETPVWVADLHQMKSIQNQNTKFTNTKI